MENHSLRNFSDRKSAALIYEKDNSLEPGSSHLNVDQDLDPPRLKFSKSTPPM